MMDDPSVTDRIITELKQLKMQGRTYAQAAELLKERGYTDAQIGEAANRFNYNKPVSYDNDESEDESAPQPLPKPVEAASKPVSTSSVAAKDNQKVGNTLRKHKRPSVRPLAYIIVAIPAGFLGAQAYRLWLHLKYLSSMYNPRYSLAHNRGYYYLSGIIGITIAVVALKLFYRSIDKPYQHIAPRTDAGTDSQKPA